MKIWLSSSTSFGLYRIQGEREDGARGEGRGAGVGGGRGLRRAGYGIGWVRVSGVGLQLSPRLASHSSLNWECWIGIWL